ncbi:phosphodiester glycosidase family protein [Turicibacter sp. TJ11]|uniref:phosphodiester glycosidase family protein n=1 Tax=Turicibacter sp. TJ11 TaxID=2806443 RepID=UPI001F39451F|nr:phosphodiester glycosidase family protein [Turicibacter sp. TJ11]
MSRYQMKQRKIWTNFIIFNFCLLIIGGCVYFYQKSTTIISLLNEKIEQQDQTIKQQHHAQTALIDANHSLQSQLEEALQTKITLEDENLSKEDQLVALTEQNQQLNTNIQNLSQQLDELTKLNEQYVAERPLSVVELEMKYRQLLTEANTKVSELEIAKNTVQKERDEIQDYYEQLNQHFYVKDDLKVKLVETRTSNQHYWIAEVISSDAIPLKGAMASDTYNGKRETISSMANRLGAILAINASGFYAKTNTPMGTVVRNGKLVNIDKSYTGEILSLKSDGNLAFTTVNSEEEFKNLDIKQTFTFGPILVRDYQATELNDKSRHPRTAIGQLDDNRYVLVVVEGRMEGADGMTLAELQQLFLQLGCKTAYNLDGGGSTTLYFQGKVINTPSDGSERSVVDMIYF